MCTNKLHAFRSIHISAVVVVVVRLVAPFAAAPPRTNAEQRVIFQLLARLHSDSLFTMFSGGLMALRVDFCRKPMGLNAINCYVRVRVRIRKHVHCVVWIWAIFNDVLGPMNWLRICAQNTIQSSNVLGRMTVAYWILMRIGRTSAQLTHATCLAHHYRSYLHCQRQQKNCSFNYKHLFILYTRPEWVLNLLQSGRWREQFASFSFGANHARCRTHY